MNAKEAQQAAILTKKLLDKEEGEKWKKLEQEQTEVMERGKRDANNEIDSIYNGIKKNILLGVYQYNKYRKMNKDTDRAYIDGLANGLSEILKEDGYKYYIDIDSRGSWDYASDGVPTNWNYGGTKLKITITWKTK